MKLEFVCCAEKFRQSQNKITYIRTLELKGPVVYLKNNEYHRLRKWLVFLLFSSKHQSCISQGSTFWGVKKHSICLKNSGLKSRFLFYLIFQFYLMYRLICRKPAHFVCPNGFGEHLFFKCLYKYLGCITLQNISKSFLVKAYIDCHFLKLLLN